MFSSHRVHGKQARCSARGGLGVAASAGLRLGCQWSSGREGRGCASAVCGSGTPDPSKASASLLHRPPNTHLVPSSTEKAETVGQRLLPAHSLCSRCQDQAPRAPFRMLLHPLGYFGRLQGRAVLATRPCQAKSTRELFAAAADGAVVTEMLPKTASNQLPTPL